MRHPLALPPLALLAAACAARPSTPALSVADAPQPILASIDLPARADVLGRWQLPPSDPWAAYAKYTLLSALDENRQRVELPIVDALAEVQRAATAGVRLAQDGLPPDTLWIVDMRGAASVAFGVAVSRHASESVSLIPTFNNWPAENELVPAEETLAALATMAPRLPLLETDGETEASTHPLFLLDAWRLAYRDEEPGDDTYDNRYILTPSDLPDVGVLRAHGIRRVVYVVESLDEASMEEDDVHAAFVDYQNAGLLVAIMDLDALEQPIAPERWDEEFAGCVLEVRPRITIVEQPGFYIRARGGFGGVRAGPSPGFGGFGGGWHGGGG
jgi:hypothetical protein